MYQKQFSLLLVCICCVGRIIGWNHVTAQSDSTIQVGINPIEPFVILEDDPPIGFSIELWDKIAKESELVYEFIEYENVAALLEGVRNREVDLAIGATSITAEREEFVDFSYPFFSSGLQIMTGLKGDTDGILPTIISFFTPTLLKIIAFAIGLLLTVAHIAWLLERKNNPQFQGSYRHGIWIAIYWTITTATTVGYDVD